MRQALRQITRRRVSTSLPIPAPTGGWDAVSPIAATNPDRALVLDNWFPTPQDVRVRRGHQVFSDTQMTTVVESLMPYQAVTSIGAKFFAVSGNKIFDITAGGLGSQSVSGLGSNRFQYINFTTPGGHFLWCCNGVDAPQMFDGTSWSAPSLTLTGFAATDIINVNAHKSRIWVVFKNSTVAGYLATEAISGAVSNLDLGNLFTKGGYLVAMGTWTHDGGNGPNDYAVFISSKGQCAIYTGTDPSSANTWSIVGVFDLGPPLGSRCFTKVGADLGLINIDGVLPISQALARDRGAVAAIALTSNINNAMNAAARDYGNNFGWQLLSYPKGTMAVLNVPISEGATQYQYVMNTLTGAWCRFTNQNANCWALFNDNLYFGGNDGVIYRADYSALDVDMQIDAIGQTAYSYYGSQGVTKQWKAVRPILTTNGIIRPAIGLSTDFADNAVLGTPVIGTTTDALFDTAVFDRDVFAVESRTSAEWMALNGIGQAGSIHFRAQTGVTQNLALWAKAQWGVDVWSDSNTGDAIMRLNGFHVLFEQGQSF